MNIKRVIAAAALTVVPLTVSSTALAAPAAPQGAPAAAAAVPAQVSADGAQYANTVLNKVNELRSSLGLQPVTRYQELDTVAQDWSEQQAAANSMSHRPDFTSAYPAGWTTGSENVAWRTAGGDTGALLFDQWLNSPGHYKNMTDPNVNSIGIGFAQTSDGRWYATQNFAASNVSNTTLTQTTSTTSNTTTTTNADGTLTHSTNTSSGVYASHKFTFDYVYDQDAQQVDVYNNTAREAVLSTLQGYNATILAYGQTGTGTSITRNDFT